MLNKSKDKTKQKKTAGHALFKLMKTKYKHKILGAARKKIAYKKYNNYNRLQIRNYASQK